jgi:hypothetical protein
LADGKQFVTRQRPLAGVHYVFGQLQPIILLSISQSTGQPQQQRYLPDTVSFSDAPNYRKLPFTAESIRFVDMQ